MKTEIFHLNVNNICVFVMNQKHVFGYKFLVTNRNMFEGHENTPQITETFSNLCVLPYI